MARCCKARAKFCVFIQTPSGRKTRGTYYKDAGAMMYGRISFLRSILTPRHSVVLYDVRKQRQKNSFCGVRHHDDITGWFYASLM